MRYAAASILLLISGCHRPSELPSLGAVPPFKLTDQSGRPFNSQTLDGRVWVADFIFTSCGGVCPRMTSQMAKVQDEFRGLSDLKFVSFTVDPAHDTPEQLAKYAREHHAAEGAWYFLTGAQDTLQMLDRDAFKLGNVDSSLQHSSRFVLLDRHSQIRGYYDTSEPDAIPHLIADIKDLLNS
jgi:protein SCO1/2